MNELQIFKNEQFGEIRTVEINNEVWFVGKDITDILGYSNGSRDINRHVEEEDRQNYQNGTLESNRGLTIINESGLYSLVLYSKLESAKKFKKWVTSEVLPSIRKHGGYLTQQKIEEALLNPDTLIELATTLKEEKQKRLEAEQLIEAQKPKVLMADTMLVSEKDFDIGLLSTKLQEKGIKGLGRNKLYSYLRENDFLIKSGERKNCPTQRSIDMKLFSLEIKPFFDKEGDVRDGFKTKVTPKGFEYFVNKFLGN